MSLNFSTFSSEIQTEFKKVMDGNSLQNWVMYGYSQGNDIKVVGTGDGGLEELKDEFEGSKIQYAFCRVLEPVSNLPKYVLISWCGDGVPTSRKGLFNVHVNEVAHYFKGFHLHIQARHEEDVEPTNVMQKVKASSGAKYSIQSNVANPSIAKPPPKPAVFKAPIAAPIKSAPIQAPIVNSAPPKPVDTPKPLYSSASSSYEPIKTNPKPLNTPSAFNAAAKEAPPVQVKNVSSIASRAQAFSQPVVENSSSGYQPIKLAPKPLYGEGVATKAFVPASGSNSNLGSNTNLGSRSNFGSKTNLGSNSNFGSKTNLSVQNNNGSSNSIARKHSFTPATRTSTTNKQQEEKIAEQRRQEERLAEQRRLENEQGQSNPSDSGEILTLQQRMEQVRMRDQELAQKQRAEQEQREREQELLRAKEGHASRAQQTQQSQLNTVTPVQSYQPPQTFNPPPPSPPMAQVINDNTAHSNTLSATALYDYTPDEANEIALVEGETITAIIQADEGWWEGCNSQGQRGFFPSNYVELVRSQPLGGSTSQQITQQFQAVQAPFTPTNNFAPPIQNNPDPLPVPSQGKSAIAMFDYDAAEENEVTFVTGDLIIEIDMVSDDWWAGKNSRTGQYGICYFILGLFPFNYVELQN